MPLQIPWENFAESFGSVQHSFGDGCSIIGQDTTAVKFVYELAEKVRPPGAAPSIAFEGGLRTRAGTLIVATIYLQLIQNRYMFRSFTILQYSHQHCVQPVASDVEVVGYI